MTRRRRSNVEAMGYLIVTIGFIVFLVNGHIEINRNALQKRMEAQQNALQKQAEEFSRKLSTATAMANDIGAPALPPELADQIEKEDADSKVDSVLQGDFNGDSLPDYAVILQERVGWRAKAFHAREDGHYTAFNLEDFGTDPQAPTAFQPEQFMLNLVKKGDTLEINGRLVPRALHDYDAIKLVKRNEPGTAAFYKWRAAPKARSERIRINGAYAISGFGGLGNE
jgi:hypothetical protein